MKHANIAVFIPHLGCPYKCLFCDQNRISRPGLAPPPSDIPDLIQKHLSTMDRNQTEVELAFFGGSFTALPESTQEAYLAVAMPYLRRGLLTGVRLSTRPDCIDQKVLAFLKGWGVSTIELGIQSFDDRVLVMSGREYSARKAEEACRMVKAAGFSLGIQLMLGLPGDNEAAVYHSTRIAVRLAPDLVRIYPTLVIKDTGLENMLSNGTYKPLSLYQAVELSKEMYIAFQDNNIPVVRIGLHSGEELRSSGTVLAGPYHPAFGELVKQAVFKEQAMMLLGDIEREIPDIRSISLLVNHRDLSKMIGNKRRNLVEIQQSLGLKNLSATGREDIIPDEIAASIPGGCEWRLDRKGFVQRRSDPINTISDRYIEGLKTT
ncbi:MAG: radical SAM protein [Syntrophomonadaceae bacterium]